MKAQKWGLQLWQTKSKSRNIKFSCLKENLPIDDVAFLTLDLLIFSFIGVLASVFEMYNW